MPITYLKGDATSPQAKGPKIIAHVCNTLGGWGKGFVLAISAKWRKPEEMYRAWHHYKKVKDIQPPPDNHDVLMSGDFGLGEVQLVDVLPDTSVCNMIAQEGLRTGSKGPPIRYEALERCLVCADFLARERGASIHAPRIGCGLAGGNWAKIGPIIERVVSAPIYVYDWDP